MDWKILNDTAQLEEIKKKSFEKTQVIFKHSTRCSISSVAKSRLEKAQAPENIDFYYLDLISYRNISNEVAEKFDVFHESPQVLMIRNGECVYDESHMSISMNEIAEQAAA
jgi:bacillithiol system protein YtxJ